MAAKPVSATHQRGHAQTRQETQDPTATRSFSKDSLPPTPTCARDHAYPTRRTRDSYRDTPPVALRPLYLQG